MKAAYRCDVGLCRQSNQDSAFCADYPVGPVSALFAVADGMGGHKAGELASREMLRFFLQNIRSYEKGALLPYNTREFWSRLVRDAGNRLFIRARGNDELEGMGTTFVSAAFFQKRIAVASIGDSRVYVLTPGGVLRQVTHDHSLVQEMMDAGQLSPEDARIHPRRNIITRAAGVSYDVSPDVFFLSQSEVKRLLLCSDGLHALVSDDTIQSILRREEQPDVLAQALLDEALAAGGNDNITAVVVDLSEGEKEC